MGDFTATRHGSQLEAAGPVSLTALPWRKEGSTTQGSPSPETGKQRLAYLDGLRALAALYVVLNHIYLHIWPSSIGRPAPEVVRTYLGWMYYGHFAVTVFIVLSGYCLGLKVLKTDFVLNSGAWGFFRSRASRILPPYYCALGISLLLIYTLIGDKTGTHWDRSLPVTPMAILVRLALLQDVFPSGQINHVFWSIALEWHIYFLFPFLLWLWRKANPWLATALFVVIGYGVDRIADETALDIVSPHFLGLFAVGALGAGISYGAQPVWDKARQRVPWSLLTLLFSTLAITLILLRGHKVFVDRADLLIGIAATSFLIALSKAEASPIRPLLEWRPLVAVGGISYSLYLVHAPLIQVIWKFLVRPSCLTPLASFLTLCAFGLPLILLASYGFFMVAERPFQARPKRLAASKNDSVND